MKQTLFLLVFAACPSPKGTPRLAFEGAEVREVDFGAVSVGRSVSKTIVLENIGAGALRLIDRQARGAATSFGAESPETIFELAGLSEQLGAGASVELPVRFHARAARSEGAAITLFFENSSLAAPLELQVLGRGRSSSCEAPSQVNFGLLVPGSTIERPLILTNDTDAPVEMAIEDLPPGAFALVTTARTVRVNARSTLEVPLRFSPVEDGTFDVPLVVKTRPNCDAVPVRLTGWASRTPITLRGDSLLSFGFVDLGSSASKTVDVENASVLPIEVEVPPMSGAFFVEPSGRLEIPGARVDPVTQQISSAVLAFRLTVRPARVGPDSAQFRVLGNFEPIVALADVFGGGPSIQAEPVDFGSVAIDGRTRRRDLVVRNRGTNLTPPMRSANLHLEENERGFWRVRALNAASLASELCAGEPLPNDGCTAASWTARYNELNGIIAGGSISIPLRLNIISPSAGADGTKAWEVIFQSNDANRPVFSVRVTARPWLAPLCQVAAPATLAFGNRNHTSAPVRALRVCNVASSSSPDRLCLVNSLSLSGPFAFEGQADSTAQLLPATVLEPQACMTVPIRALPALGVSPVPSVWAGHLVLDVSTSNNPRSIALQTEDGVGCLVVDPWPLDFGPVPMGCAATRTVRLFNQCQAPISFRSHVLSDSGERMLSIVSGPTAGTTLSFGQAPLTLQLRYTPTVEGSMLGSLAIRATTVGGELTEQLTVRGEGVQARFTEQARVGYPRRHDVMMLVEGTPAFRSEHPRLVEHLGTLVHEAADAGVDLRMSVLRPFTSANCQWPCDTAAAVENVVTSFSPTMPDAGNHLATYLLGVGGALRSGSQLPNAFIAPSLASHNVGIVRDDATLGVLVVGHEQTATFIGGHELALLSQVKGTHRPGAFSVSRIVGSDGGCQQPVSVDPLVTSFNGVSAEVCSVGWPEAMRSVSRAVTGFQPRVFLSGRPDPGSQLVVTRDGGVISGWHYEPVTNTVRFDGGVSMDVSISYDVACE